MKKNLCRAVLSMAAALLIVVSALPRTAYAAGASLTGSSSVQVVRSFTGRPLWPTSTMPAYSSAGAASQ